VSSLTGWINSVTKKDGERLILILMALCDGFDVILFGIFLFVGCYEVIHCFVGRMINDTDEYGG